MMICTRMPGCGVGGDDDLYGSTGVLGWGGGMSHDDDHTGTPFQSFRFTMYVSASVRASIHIRYTTGISPLYVYQRYFYGRALVFGSSITLYHESCRPAMSLSR